jgi:M6 family metalloprotease-like protein
MKPHTITTALTVALLLATCAAADDGPQATPNEATAGVVRLTGTFHVVWIDPLPDTDAPPGQEYALYDDKGRRWTLVMHGDTLAAAGGLLALNGQVVTVEGQIAQAPRPTLVVETITAKGGPEAPDSPRGGVYGSQPYVWILMRFADDPSTPEDPPWFWTQALGGYPSLDHYWREISYNNIDLLGSVVVGWYDLPHPRSYYVYDIDPEDPGDELDGERTIADAIAVADADVYFPAFAGFLMMYNGELDGAAYGGRGTLTIDGQTKEYGIVWMPQGGWRAQSIMAHELGHSFGLPHSSGPYDETYDSQWDVMSRSCGACTYSDPTYGELALHTIAYHKNELGWIHPLHRYEMPMTPTVASVWLHDLVVPPPAGRLLMARITWSSDPWRFYSFERRYGTGYDQNLPGESVIIHDVLPGRMVSDPQGDLYSDRWAQVVDADGDGDCNDEGAQWEPGESFSDVANTIVATVEWADEYSSILTLTNAARTYVYVNWANSGYEDGTATYPWNTVWEGHGAAYPGGSVYIAAGSYPETLTLRKPATLRRSGTTGVVRIGQ